MRRVKGFTLIEVIVVVSIILTLLSIVMPSTILQMRKSIERKYFTEGKIIESAIEIYNLESINKKILKYENLYSVRNKLTNSSKKYISSWPSKLKCSINGVEMEISDDSLDEYTLDSLLKYISEKEGEYQ